MNQFIIMLIRKLNYLRTRRKSSRTRRKSSRTRQSAPLLGRTTTVEDNKTQVNLEKGVSSHQIIVSRSNLEEEKRQEGLQKSDRSCSDAISESKEDTTSLGQSLRELKMDMAKSQNQRYIHTTYKSITI